MVKDAKPIAFSWEKASDLYTLNGGTATYNAGGTDSNRPVIGSYEMKPNTGRYFWEIRLNCDNSRIGLATTSAEVHSEMGKTPDVVSINLQTGSVEVGGVEKKRLWRLVTPVSGGVFGCCYDSSTGVMQLYLNEEFQGTAINDSCQLKGKTVFPCVGLAGVELHNRDIGVGKKYAAVTAKPQLYRTLV